MHKIKELLYDLQLFAEGGAVAGGDGGNSAPMQSTESTLPKADTHQRGSSRRAKTGEYDNVVFGKQEDAPTADNTNSSDTGNTAEGNGNSGVSTTSDTLEAKRAAFKELIEGEYKDQYSEMFQQAFNRRFKEVKGMEASLNAQKPILDMLLQRYKIEDGDMTKLQTALEEDNEYWASVAEESGMTVEQYKAVQKLERENAELRAMRQRQAGEQQAQAQLAKWLRESESLKQLYPSFDLRTELASNDFRGLLKAGIPVQKAYELMHMDEIRDATARSAAQTASAQMTAKIKSKASRPSENGTSSQSAVIVKNDVSNLSRKDRAEIARRVQRGEKITF